MTFPLIVLIPVVLAIAYAVYRRRMNRSVTRRTIDTFLGLLVLVYFLITSTLGIFWVARQELPVFDIHYLFGYATIVLVIIHVVLNWPTVSTFFRQLAPRHLLTDEGRKWRFSVRAFSWVALWTAYGIVCFWLGGQNNVSQIRITGDQGAVTNPQATDVPEYPASGLIGTQWVESGSERRSLADYYHENTKHSLTSIMGGGAINWEQRPGVFKEYPDADLIPLPDPLDRADVTVGRAIELARQLSGGSSPTEVTLQGLSTLLFMTNGTTSTLTSSTGSYFLRAAPSAGALYPTITYVLVRDVAGLLPGLYHYAVNEHALHRIADSGDLARELSELASQGESIANAAVTFLFTSMYFRSSWKYQERAYRYCGLDAGHLAIHTSLSASALGYDHRFIGRFDDTRVNELLGVDEGQEGVMLIMPIAAGGGRAGESAPQRLRFRSMPRELQSDQHPLLHLMHGRTYLAAGPTDVPSERPIRAPSGKPYAGRPRIPLPREFDVGDDLFTSIRQRRSRRDWSQQPMSLAQFSSVLFSAHGLSGSDAPFSQASVENNHAINVYVLVNNVQGLDPGVYYYDRFSHSLVTVREGDHRQEGYTASLSQDAVGNAQANVIMTIDPDRLMYPDGDRGYRYALLDAGMLGGRLYLHTTALGLGTCGIGAYFDDDVSELIDVPPDEELVIYMAAMGVRDNP